MRFLHRLNGSGWHLVRLAGLILLVISAQGRAAPGREDIDTDDDGLIELVDIDDLIYVLTVAFYESLPVAAESATGLDLKVLYGETRGCPPSGCIGYELAGDIDLTDLTADGISGNEALQVSNSSSFSGILEGNGHRLLNYRNAVPAASYALMRFATNATVRNLVMTGPESQVGGINFNESAGGAMLVAIAENVLVHDCVFEGDLLIHGLGSALAYAAQNAYFINNRIRLDVEGQSLAGLVSGAGNSVFIANDITLSGTGSMAGLMFQDQGEPTNRFTGNRVRLEAPAGTVEFAPFLRWGDAYLKFNYAEVAGEASPELTFGNSTALASLAGNYVPQGYTAAASPQTPGAEEIPTLAEGCVLAPSMECDGSVWFQNWDSLQDDLGASVWDFETSARGPVIRSGLVFGDADDDQVPDQFDDFPLNRAAAVDADGDGAPDAWRANCRDACQAHSGLHLDQFPDHFAASRDDDQNGQPDAWNPVCDQACRDASGLQVDAVPQAGAFDLRLLVLLSVGGLWARQGFRAKGFQPPAPTAD